MTQQQSATAPLRREDIHAAVQEALTTYGVYSPVELLLNVDWLDYPGYEAWWYGHKPSLESVIEAEPRHITALMKTAAEWARTNELQAEEHRHFGWGGNAHQQLVFSSEPRPEAESLLATRYVRTREPAAGDQLDLFLDSGVTVTLQDLRAALLARDTTAAKRCLDTLVSVDGEHSLLPAARRLVDALDDLSRPVASGQAASELAHIEQVVWPDASAVLGSQTRDVMAAFWQRLAASLNNEPFDPQAPKLHASYAFSRCLDWRRAITAIEGVPAYDSQPSLLTRLATARYYDGQYPGAIAAWCMLCWGSADAAEKALGELPATATRLHAAWTAFRDMDLDPAPETAMFPAYLLLAEPGLARALSADFPGGDSPGGHSPGGHTLGERAFNSVRRLLLQDATEARQAVQAAAPWLLTAYYVLRTPG